MGRAVTRAGGAASSQQSRSDHDGRDEPAHLRALPRLRIGVHQRGSQPRQDMKQIVLGVDRRTDRLVVLDEQLLAQRLIIAYPVRSQHTALVEADEQQILGQPAALPLHELVAARPGTAMEVEQGRVTSFSSDVHEQPRPRYIEIARHTGMMPRPEF
jgi:hypothetical protein